MRVFVSSTVFDLIDVRAEVRQFLEELGVIPVLSDYASNGFLSVPDANSIEACAENVRSCDAVIMIVSQRYGPPLNKVLSYLSEPLSATHYEYRAAKEANIPVFLYARDKLVAEWNIWKKQGRPHELGRVGLLWTPIIGAGGWDNASRLFAFLDEHARLHDEAKNWITSFSDSVQLKQAIENQIGIVAKRQLFIKRLVDGLVPEVLLFVNVTDPDSGYMASQSATFLAKNISVKPAIRVKVEVIGRDVKRETSYLAAGQDWTFWYFKMSKARVEANLMLVFEDAFGCAIVDHYLFNYAPNAVPGSLAIERIERRFRIAGGSAESFDAIFPI
jgi:hypothetical protein